MITFNVSNREKKKKTKGKRKTNQMLWAESLLHNFIISKENKIIPFYHNDTVWLINSKRRRWKWLRGESGKWNFTDLSKFHRLLSLLRRLGDKKIAEKGRKKKERKEKKTPPQDMIMIQLIFMMAVDWVPLKFREQSMALKVNHEIDFFNMNRIRLNIDTHFRFSVRTQKGKSEKKMGRLMETSRLLFFCWYSPGA